MKSRFKKFSRMMKHSQKKIDEKSIILDKYEQKLK